MNSIMTSTQISLPLEFQSLETLVELPPRAKNEDDYFTNAVELKRWANYKLLDSTVLIIAD